MTKDELARVIESGIQQLSFAKVPVAAVSQVFASDQQTPTAIPDALREFADNHGWDYQHAQELTSGEVVFYPKGTEAPGL